jgi:CheY-like chemotaxis protein
VLLVEDQEPVRHAIAGALRRFGCAVTEARSGADALAHLETGEPCALVVTDVIMPGMTGVDLAEQVRARYPRIRLLMMTGHVPDGTLARRLEELRLPVLRKPFSPEELERIVSERLDLERPTIPPEPGLFVS